MTPRKYLKLKRSLEQIRNIAIQQLGSLISEVEFPSSDELRRAKPTDIVEGNIIFYPSYETEFCGTQHAFWQVVSQVDYPNDSFKAYTGEDGCRYGLENAFVLRKRGGK